MWMNQLFVFLREVNKSEHHEFAQWLVKNFYPVVLLLLLPKESCSSSSNDRWGNVVQAPPLTMNNFPKAFLSQRKGFPALKWPEWTSLSNMCSSVMHQNWFGVTCGLSRTLSMFLELPVSFLGAQNCIIVCATQHPLFPPRPQIPLFQAAPLCVNESQYRVCIQIFLICLLFYATVP